MKLKIVLFLVIFLASPVLWAQERLPRPAGYVSDFAAVLSGEDKVKLEALFSELEKKTTAEATVVIVETTRPEEIETYAVNLFEKWGIGKKGKDNGLLLLVAVKDRKVRIEVGYGLEGAVPDALAKQIIDRMIIPYFKKGDYSKGITAGSTAMVNLAAKEYNVSLSGLKDFAPALPLRSKSSLGNLSFLLFFIIFFGFMRGLLWWSILTPRTHRRRGGFWYGSGFGGGGFSGGFGGFGGGFSGGGGASSGW